MRSHVDGGLIMLEPRRMSTLREDDWYVRYCRHHECERSSGPRGRAAGHVRSDDCSWTRRRGGVSRPGDRSCDAPPEHYRPAHGASARLQRGWIDLGGIEWGNL